MSTLRYGLYLRKSNESEERQERSIPDQSIAMRELAASRSLNIVKVLTDEKTAKEPRVRPGFDELIEDLVRGRLDAILCYHINRLSRNRLESGMLEHYLQEGIIKEIVTVEKTYYPGDNAFIMGVEGIMANQYSRDLSKVVRDRMYLKAKRGEFPHAATHGYLNDRESKIIVPDPDRFPQIRKVWEFALEGYSCRRIATSLDQMGFRTRKRKKIGNAKIGMTAVYNILRNIFYAGYFYYKGELMKGNHKPMVTLEEFQKVQDLLSGRGKPRPKRKWFTYSGLITCGHCGCTVTAENACRKMKNGTIHVYTYYHCTNARGNCGTKVIHEHEIDRQVDRLLESLQIDAEYEAWGKDVCQRWQDEVADQRDGAFRSQESSMKDLEKLLDELLTMRLNREITPEEYMEQKGRLTGRLNDVRIKYQEMQGGFDKARREIEQALSLRERVRMIFTRGAREERRELAKAVGASFTLKDGHLIAEPRLAYRLIHDAYLTETAKNRTLETVKVGSESTMNAAVDRMRSSWWASLNDVRNALLQSYLPNYSTTI